MTDERMIRLLEEMCDLQRQHLERYAEALMPPVRWSGCTKARCCSSIRTCRTGAGHFIELSPAADSAGYLLVTDTGMCMYSRPVSDTQPCPAA